MTELRLYLQRDGLHDGQACPWALLDREGRLLRSGASLAEAPRADVCRLVVEADRVVTFAVDLPDLPERRLAPLLANAVEPASLDEAEQLHVVRLGRDGAGKTLCAAVSAPWLERFLTRLAERDVYPQGAVAEGLLVPWEPDSWSVVANEGHALVRLDARRVLAVDASDPPVGLMLALGRETRPNSIRLYRGNRLRAPDVAAWSAALGVEVVAAGDWDWRKAAWPATGNLLTGRLATRRAGPDWRGALKPLAWGALALAIIQALGLVAETLILRHEQQQLYETQRQLARRVLPAQAAVVDPVWQVSEAHARLVDRERGDEAGMRAMMARLGEAWSTLPGAKLRHVEYSEGALEVGLAGRPEAWLAQFEAGAARHGLSVKTRGQGNDVVLRVTATAMGGQHGR